MPLRSPRYTRAAGAHCAPCRRFADNLAVASARLGADAVCYSFTAVDLHHLLSAGLPGAPKSLIVPTLLDEFYRVAFGKKI